MPLIGSLLNGIKANTSKFLFMIVSNERLQKQYIDIADGTTLGSEPFVKVLGLIIDDRLQLSGYVNACCLKAAKLSIAISGIYRHVIFKIEIHNL